MNYNSRKLYSRLKKCPICNCDLQLDDIDFMFKGCQDEYYFCSNENCEMSFYVKVRYDKACKHQMIDGDGVVSEIKV